jgi:ATP-binding cassette subfamily B protein
MLRYTRLRWFIYYLGLFGSGFVGLGFSYIFAMAYKGITDAALAGDMGSVLNRAITLLVEFVLLTVANSFTIYQIYANSKRINSVIRKELFAHIQKLPMSYFENQHSGDLISRLTNDINGACIIYGDPIHMVVRSIISGIGSGFIIFSLNWKMGVATIAIGILNILVNIFFVKPLKEISKKVQAALSGLNQRFSDTLVGIHIIKIFNLKNVVFEKYRIDSLDALRSSL